MTSVSRRTFLGTAAAASVSAVAAPAMAASTSGNNLPAKWDDTVDVVVLGCGGAGMMAACQAHDAVYNIICQIFPCTQVHTPIYLTTVTTDDFSMQLYSQSGS